MASNKPSGIERVQETVFAASGIGGCYPAEVSKMQKCFVLWLDNHIDNNDEDCQNTIAQLRSVVDSVSSFTNNDECIDFILNDTSNNVCMIVSGSLGRHIMPCIHDISQLHCIFVFCGDKKHHEQWTKQWYKIKGVYTDVMSICEGIKQAVHQCEHNAMPMSFVTPGKKLDQLDSSFMYTQILKEILLTIKFEDEHIRQFVDYWRGIAADNDKALNKCTHFERSYRQDRAIWWYSTESFLYSTVNHTLRQMDVDLIVRMGFLIHDLHQQLDHLHKQQFSEDRSSTQSFTVYRGQGLSKTNFDELTRSKGSLLSFNSFLSTSKERNVSIAFAESSAGNPDLVGILFVIRVDPIQSTMPFACIRGIGQYDSEDEILFSMHSVCRIYDVQPSSHNNRFFEVILSLTSDSDEELRALTDCIREESYPDDEGWCRLGLVLIKMGKLNKAEEIHEILANQTMSAIDRASILDRLGSIKSNQGQLEEANKMYEQSYAILQQSLPPNHPDLASSFNNIGIVYNSLGDYSKALSFYEKALAIRQQSLPPNHPHLASSFGNIANAYIQSGDYSKALSFYEKALAVQQQSLPSNHSALEKSYNNISFVYEMMNLH